jgi:hypothetical protein
MWCTSLPVAVDQRASIKWRTFDCQPKRISWDISFQETVRENVRTYISVNGDIEERRQVSCERMDVANPWSRQTLIEEIQCYFTFSRRLDLASLVACATTFEK